jgi:hypothetical protein
MIQRALKRRNEWVDFHCTEFTNDPEHEKKLRFNYFQDSTLTNPELHDFRPTSFDLKKTRQGPSMKNDGNLFKSSQNVVTHSRWENKDT